MAKDNKQDEQGIPGMEIDTKYSPKKPVVPQTTEKAKKEMEKTKKELEKLKGIILKKYNFVRAISIIPPQALKLFIEEEIGENVPQEEADKLMKKIHLYIIVPEEKLKEIPKIKKEIVKEIEKSKQNVWLYVKTPIDVWEACLDSKFEIVSAIAMSFPLYDKGLLESLRVAEIHKSLVLQKFEKYVVSYVLGGSLVRGDVVKTSDVDVFLIINDTDVKKMPRLELKERLRSIIYQYISEANALAGTKKNILNVQIYLLTDFWESVKDAHPVIFTFIRDGVPIYDRGTFMPWKALLKMGKLKPSPEAIDVFMSMGDKTVKRAKAALLDILIHDIFWGVNTPSQALLMLYGLPPPNVKETAKEFRNIFVNKEKMIEKKYADILEEITIKYYKGFEHGKIKEVTGKEIDHLLKNTEDFLKRMKDLRDQIEKKAQEKTIEQIYKDIFELLASTLGKKPQEKTVDEFEKELVKKGKFTFQHLNILKEIIAARAEFKKGKSSSHKIEQARKNAMILINDLIEYSQRKDLITLEKGRMRLRYKVGNKPQTAELLNYKGTSFLFLGNVVKKITNKVQNSNMQEVSKVAQEQKDSQTLEINPKIFELLKEELGEFQIVL